MNMTQKIITIWQSYGLIRIIAACFGAHTTSLMVGLSQGYSAILLPQLMIDTNIVTDNESASWIASLGVISNPIGALMAGLLSEWFGRKRTVQFSSLPYITGWFVIAEATTNSWLCIGRFITGLAVGMITTTYTYIAEITPANERGIMAAFGPVMTSFGVLLVYVLGYFLHWKTVAIFCVILSLTVTIIMHVVPESPPWLVSQYRYKDAFDSLKWLRANKSIAERDLITLLASCTNDQQQAKQLKNMKNMAIFTTESYLKNEIKCKTDNNINNTDNADNADPAAVHATVNDNDTNNKSKFPITISTQVQIIDEPVNSLSPPPKCKISIVSLLRSPKTYKPFCILLLFFMFQELSGIYIVLFYSVNFLHAVGTNVNDYIGTIIVGTLRFITSIIGAILIQKHKRKTLSTISGVGMGIFLFGCACYLKYYEVFQDQDRIISWFPLVCILSCVVFSMFGFLQLPYVMNSELFPLKVRGIMSGTVLSIANIFIFISVKIYPNLVEYFHLSGMLFLFASASLIGGVYCYLFLPETKNKTLMEIEEMFENKNKISTRKYDVETFASNNQQTEQTEQIKQTKQTKQTEQN